MQEKFPVHGTAPFFHHLMLFGVVFLGPSYRPQRGANSHPFSLLLICSFQEIPPPPPRSLVLSQSLCACYISQSFLNLTFLGTVDRSGTKRVSMRRISYPRVVCELRTSGRDTTSEQGLKSYVINILKT